MVKESKRGKQSSTERGSEKKERRPGRSSQGASLSRHVLTGAALGLYFGLFFRPAREPSLLVVLGLSLISALAITLLQLRHPEQRNAGRLLRYFLKSWAGFALVLAMLELRHYFYDLGGRLATSLFTVVYGAALGFIYAKMGGQEAR